MKILKIVLIIISILLINSCYDINSVDNAVISRVNLTIDTSISSKVDKKLLSKIIVKFQNIIDKRVHYDTCDKNGNITLDLKEGIYNISVGQECKDTILGVENEYALNGAIENYNIKFSANISFQVTQKKIIPGLVFSEIYYTGSKTHSGNSYWYSQFIEIYNNSKKVIYLDSLCIGVLEQVSSSASKWVTEEVKDKYALSFQTWMFPGTGKTYPINPGETQVLAIKAINHKEDNPVDSTVDLSNAKWEFYFDLSGRDIDTKAINLTMIYTMTQTMYDFLMTVFGPAIVMFKLPQNYFSYVTNTDNLKMKPSSSGSTRYLVIPRSSVIDAVECVESLDQCFKRLDIKHDAGFVYDKKGTYTGKSVRRKVKRFFTYNKVQYPYYQDTDNSTNDFISGQVPSPGTAPNVIDKD